VARITVSQLLARLPLGMLALGVLIHVNASTGSYGFGGVVLACFSVAEAAIGPVSSRLLGRWGVRRVLLVTTVVCSAAILLIALTPPSLGIYLVLGSIAGLSVPPIMPAVRSLYPQLVRPDLLHALFTLDTSSQEAIWIVGPVLAAVLASSVSTVLPLVVAAGVMLAGGAWLITAPGLRAVRIAENTARFGRALLHGTVALSGITSFMLVASFCALEVAVLARGGGASTMSGITIASNAFGSMLGGVLLGRRASGRRSVVILMASILIFTAWAGIASNEWVLLVTVFLAGFGFAPAVGTMYSYVSISVPEGQLPEAFGWLNTGSLTGAAVGTAVGGFATDTLGAGGAFAAATAFAAAGVLFAAAARAWYPTAAAISGSRSVERA
jgi:MFS family permease